jgi:hypothetical protein
MPSFLLMFLKAKLVDHLFFDNVSLCIPTWSATDYSTFTVHRNFKVSPSARCVSADNAVCRSINIFNKDCIWLTDVSKFS